MITGRKFYTLHPRLCPSKPNIRVGPEPLLNRAGSDLARGRLLVRDMVLGWVTASK